MTKKTNSIKNAPTAAESKGKDVDSTRVIKVDSDMLVAIERGDIFVKPTQVFIDLLAGNVEFEQLYADQSNVQFLIRMFKDDPEIKERISEFYRSMVFEKVMLSLVTQSYIKPSDVHFGAVEFTTALATEGGLAQIDAMVVADQLIPALRAAGFNISVPERYVTRAVYKHVLVTTENLKADVAAQHCASIMDKVKFSVLGTNKYGRKVLAEQLSVDLRHAGARMLTQAAYGKVVDGAVIAVRANLDHENEAYRLAVPDWLRDHPVIAELSENLTFITAAFSSNMKANPVLDIDSDDMRKYLDVLSASLKASARYKCVTVKHLLEEYTLKHGYDYNEEVAFASVIHNVAYEPGVVAALPTIVNNEVTYLDKSDSRVAELLMAHDQGMFSLIEAGLVVHKALEANVSDVDYWPVDSKPFISLISLGDDFLSPEVLIALSTADRVALRCTTDEAGRHSYLVNEGVVDAGKVALPDFVYYANSDGKRLPMQLRNRMLDRSTIITADPSTVVLLAKPFDTKRPRRSSPQLPDASVYGAHLLAVPSEIVQRLNQGVDYKLSVGSNSLAGKFYLKSIDALRTGKSQGVLVNPVNARITEVIAQALSMAIDCDSDIRHQLAYNSVIYMYIIAMAERLSPSFREDVHQRLIAQAMPNVSADESAAMRSAYNRSVFAAQVDMFAMKVYLEALGCSSAARLFDALAEDEAMQIALSQQGSKRRK